MSTEALADQDDPRLALYRNVSDGELLRAHGVFVAEGRLVVRRLLTSSRFRTRSVLVTPTAWSALEDVLQPTTVPVHVVAQTLLDTITGFNIHRGCLAIGEREPALHWQTLTTGARRLVILEGVANADNVGAIFRNAAAFGIDAVLLDPVSTDPLYRKAIRTSMGAVLSTPFARMEPWPASLAQLRHQEIVVCGLTPSATFTVRDIVRMHAGRPTALLLGHEGAGLSAGALQCCDTLARIPMAGSVDSLNVATAAAVALYELTRACEPDDRPSK